MRIYHYTTIKTLALILKSRSILFNRLDQVDDLEESLYPSGPTSINLAKYVFVSCWSKNKEENLALWKMYAGYDGIRLSFDSDLFTSYPNVPFNTFQSFYPSLFHFEKDYCADQYTNAINLEDIKYVDNPQHMVDHLITSDLPGKYDIYTGNLGLYKRKEWSIQNESRFRIRVFPLNFSYIKSYTFSMLNQMNLVELRNVLFELLPALKKSLAENYQIEEKSILVPLKQDAINGIEVMMGPLCTDADRIIVESLLRDCQNSNICESIFKNKIKVK